MLFLPGGFLVGGSDYTKMALCEHDVINHNNELSPVARTLFLLCGPLHA